MENYSKIIPDDSSCLEHWLVLIYHTATDTSDSYSTFVLVFHTVTDKSNVQLPGTTSSLC